ncbi:MAG TPA: PKD domain-containing protein, partial [Blastocatellia bacterium]|nr:PKD domain-containing protein [Blastocatellia bacterium]
MPAPQSGGISLTALGSSFNNAGGVDYHQPTNQLAVSVNYPTGQPRNIELIAADGTHAGFSSLAGLSAKLRIATARDEGGGFSRGGFRAGDLFTGTGMPGVVARLAADGSSVQNPWVSLPSEAGVINALYIDRTGVYGGDLLAVTSQGNVWRITAPGAPTLVAVLGAAADAVISVPNDASKYGPWAGKILAAIKTQSRLNAINPQGVIESYPLGVNPQDLDLIPANENLLAVDSGAASLLGASANQFAAMVGDLLVTQNQPGALWRIHWTGTEFQASQLALANQLESAAFAPAGVFPLAPTNGLAAVVRHAPSINGRVEGAVRQLTGESLLFNSGAVVTTDLMVPGTPQVILNGTPSFGGTITGTGSASPTGYQVTLNSGSTLGHLLTRVDPITLPTVATPPTGSGTRDVTINTAGQSPGDFATLRDLTLNSNVGVVAVPPGSYRNFTANSGSGFVFGVAGSSTPSVYNLRSLTLNGTTQLQIAGPVVLTLALGTTLNGTIGTPSSALWLTLKVASGSVTLNSGSLLYGTVIAPSSTVTINGNSTQTGSLQCDRLTVNSGGLLRGAADAVAPSITIDQPAEGTVIDATQTVVSGTVYDQTAVTVTVNGVTATVSGNAYTATVPLVMGANTVTATATDLYGNTASASRHVTRATNQAPTVNAGADQTISLPSSAALNGSASDDGLPAGSTLNVTWSKVSGPGTVTFVNPNQAVTTASFSAAGTYTLRLTASDGQLTSSDDAVITVTPQNQAPQVNAGPDQAVSFNLLQNPGNEQPLVNGKIPAWTEVTGNSWTQATAGANGFPASYQGSTYFYPGQVAQAELMQDVDVAAFASSIAAGTQTFRFKGYVRSFDESPADSGRIIVEYRDAANATVLASFDASALQSTSQWTLVSDTRTAPAGTRWIRVRLIGVRNTGVNCDSYFDHLTLEAPTLAAAMLNGTATDDGLPLGSALATSWTKMSGPGTVTFTNLANPVTWATFDAPGTYVLRLNASDSALTASADVTVTVTAINQAPVVSAGADQAINLPTNQVTLNGTASDDGLPAGGTLTTTWTKVSGPGAITFANAAQLATTASFDVPGTYVLRLTASDSDLSSSDDLIVSINQVPTVNAGADQTITLPSAATLNGTATDDGLPAGSTLSVSWSKVSGPGAVTFGNATQAATTASFTAAGTYILRLTATDSALSSSDDLTVTVVSPNQPPVVNAGADQTISLPASAALNGSASDDGLPAGGSLTVTWSKISGPGSVTFTNPNQAVASASFSAPGTYTLRLTASDGELSSSDDILINVTPQNQAPVVNAGPDQNISLPANTATLSGSVTDDGLPIGGSLSILWTKVSGPGAVTFADATHAVTTATFATAGVYVLRLIASDGQLSASDDLTVTVDSPTLTLSPAAAGPLVAGTSQTMTATLRSGSGAGIEGVTVQFNVTGANPTGGSVVTNSSGVATFTYAGANNGDDTVIAAASALQVQSNAATISWVVPRQAISTTTVFARFFTSDGSGSFTTPPTAQPVFTQYVPTINYNPPAGTVPGNTSGVTIDTRPFTNVTTDLNNNFTGTIVAQGNGYQAGVGPLNTFNAVFTGSFVVAAAGDVTFNFFTDDGFILGIGGGATRVSGTLNNPPASGLSPFAGLPVMGSFNDRTAPTGSTIAVHFPAPGVYPYEVDYSECCGGQLVLTMATTASGNKGVPPTGSLTLTPGSVSPQTGGGQMTFTVTAKDASGQLLAGVPVTLAVTGANELQLTATTDNTGSATFTYRDTILGTDYLQAVGAVNGMQAYSNVTQVQWVQGANAPPVVSAWPDQRLAPPLDRLLLSGTATDDGKPAGGGPLTYEWKKISGPGTVTFSDPTQRITYATFSAPGTYVLRFAASDSDLTGIDYATIIVGTACSPSPAGLSAWWMGEGNARDLLGGHHGTPTAGVSYAAGKAGQAFSFNGSTSSFVDVPTINAGTTFTVEFWMYPRRLSGSQNLFAYDPRDANFGAFQVVETHLEYWQANRRPAATAAGSIALNQWTHVALTYDGSTARLYINGQLAGSGAASGISFNAPVRMGHSVVGLDLPFFGLMDEVSVYNRALTDTEVQALAAAGDGKCTPPVSNQAPVINAGPDQRLVSPANSTTLNATASDDGRPEGGPPLAYQWSVVSGPGTVTFGSPNQLVTTAAFSADGLYLLRLTVSDSQLSTTDDVVVKVGPACMPAPAGMTHWWPGEASARDVIGGSDGTLRNGASFATAKAGQGFSLDGLDDFVQLPDNLFAFPTGGTGNTPFSFEAWFKTSGGGVIVGQQTAAPFSTPNGYVPAVYVGTNGKLYVEMFWAGSVSQIVSARAYNDGVFHHVGVSYDGATERVYVDGGLIGSQAQTQVSYFGSYKYELGIGYTNGWPATNGGWYPFNGVLDEVRVYNRALTATEMAGLYLADSDAICGGVPNQAPTVSAGADQTITLPAMASLQGTASDDGLPQGSTLTYQWSKVSGPGTVTFSNATQLATTASFTAAGTYVLRLTASDGQLTTSDDVQVTVIAQNQPPVVNAGADQTITLPATASLNGTATDDGLPQGSTLTYQWSKVSGPGTVTFSNATQLATTASFTAAGTYVLRLTASDGALSASDDVQVTVNPAPVNQPPQVNAGPDQVAEIGTNLVVNGSNEAALVNGEISGWTEVVGNGWTQATAGAGGFPAAQSGATYFYAGATATAELNQDVDVRAYPANTQFDFRAWLRSGNETPADSSQVILDYRNTANTQTIARLTIEPNTASSDWQQVTDLRALPAGTGYVRIRLIATRNSGTTNDGYFDAISLRAVGVAAARLQGTATDDGLPTGSGLSVSWSQVSGPGAATFAASNQADTTVSFTTAGVYVLRLTATDGALSASDDVQVTVTAQNQAPTVNAGADQTISIAGTASLSGSVSDDGLPLGNTLAVQWSAASGPGTVTFGNAAQAATTASFTATGVYVLRLTASDGEYSTSDDVQVTVSANTINQAPQVSAGADQAINLPTTQATLNGTATDDGLPTGSSLAVQWSQVSGPAGVTFLNAAQAVTQASFPGVGVYLLRLTATDGSLSASDDVQVTVYEAISGPPPVVAISSPADGAEVTAPTSVVGSIDKGNWRLEYSLNRDSEAASPSWTLMASGSTPVSNASLAQLDPTLLLNGIYSIRLTSVDSSGQVGQATIAVIVGRALKVGLFTLSFNDLSVPVAGLPIQVIRTYDSRDKRQGDFGTGWTLSLNNIRLEKSVNLGRFWNETVDGGLFPRYCLQPSRAHLVTITFPDGKVYKFQATTAPQCQTIDAIRFATVSYAQQPGTAGTAGATLAAVGNNDVVVDGGIPGSVNLVGDSGLYNPRVFQLTTGEGLKYVIEEGVGLRSMTDLNGNTLQINSSGIIHSSGKSIVFTRDSQGRITQITDPAGNVMSYGYD